MDFNKITEKAEPSAVSTDSHVLITQGEKLGNNSTESLRRAPLSMFVDACLESMGLAVVDGFLCAIIEL